MSIIDTQLKTISAFPYASNFVDVLDSQMHYIQAGKGDPIVFLHGMPTWSYIWRNVIPFVKESGHCIAVDHIGMGRSGRPTIPYHCLDYVDYFAAFIEALDLHDITLVLHDWGAFVGLCYAMDKPERIKAVAFLEAYVKPFDQWESISLPMQEFYGRLRQNPEIGKRRVIRDNFLVETLLPMSTMRPLSPLELNWYRQPFNSPKDRELLWAFVEQIPVMGMPCETNQIMADYSDYLKKTNIPKLMMYALPGALTPISVVEWCLDNLSNIDVVDLGEAFHLIPEDKPDLVGQQIRDWMHRRVI